MSNLASKLVAGCDSASASKSFQELDVCTRRFRFQRHLGIDSAAIVGSESARPTTRQGLADGVYVQCSSIGAEGPATPLRARDAPCKVPRDQTLRLPLSGPAIGRTGIPARALDAIFPFGRQWSRKRRRELRVEAYVLRPPCIRWKIFVRAASARATRIRAASSLMPRRSPDLTVLEPFEPREAKDLSVWLLQFLQGPSEKL